MSRGTDGRIIINKNEISQSENEKSFPQKVYYDV